MKHDYLLAPSFPKYYIIQKDMFWKIPSGHFAYILSITILLKDGWKSKKTVSIKHLFYNIRIIHFDSEI